MELNVGYIKQLSICAGTLVPAYSDLCPTITILPSVVEFIYIKTNMSISLVHSVSITIPMAWLKGKQEG